jgi:HEAT repeat protein
MKALADIGYKPAIATISAQLRGSAAPETRRTALQAIGAIGGSEALDAILDLVKAGNRDSLSPELLEASTQALAGIAAKGNTDPRIQNSLKDLSSNGRPAIRRIAASGLGSFNNQLAIDTLVAVVNAEKDPGVRKAALIALNRQAGDQVMPTLQRVLREKDLDSGVKATALAAVGGNKLGSTGIQQLVDALADDDASVRAAASGSLMQLASQSANAPLVSGALSRSLAASGDAAFQVEAAGLLASLADATTIPTLLALLGKPVPELKQISAWALYRLRNGANPKVSEELQKLVTNENEGMPVRVNAVRALGAIGYDSQVLNVWQTLVTTTQMRGDKYAMLRFYAVKSLGQLLPMKSQASSALLRLATKDADQEMRKEAVFALRAAASLDKDSAEALAGSYVDAKDPELKVRIIEALADSGSAKAIDLSQDFLAGTADPALKRRVVSALAQNPSELSASAILDAARDQAMGDFVVGVMEGFPARVLASVVSRRQRTETDKNVLSVLTSLGSLTGD